MYCTCNTIDHLPYNTYPDLTLYLTLTLTLGVHVHVNEIVGHDLVSLLVLSPKIVLKYNSARGFSCVCVYMYLVIIPLQGP